jgi:hypothetical protein
MLLAVAVVSTVVAIAMIVVAWRAVRVERERSAARVETLARAIGASEPSTDLRLRSMEDAAVLNRAAPVLSAPQSGVGSRLGLSLAVGAFVVTTAAAAAIVFSSESSTTSVGATPAASAPGDENAPIELVSLDHERDGDTLIVHGVVRNPLAGVPMTDVAAVVSSLGFDGRALSTTRAAIESPSLSPGEQSAFSVTIPHADAVGRYRVSFRSGDRVVSHVDKRLGS